MSLILSGTEGLSDVDGSAATPAIRGTDANTGIFFGTDIIGFSEGGVEAMRIDSASAVLVNTTSQTGSTRMVVADATGNGQIRAIHSTGLGLNINQATASGVVYIQQQDNAGLGFATNNAERVRIDASGLFGINTTSPSRRLTVASGSATKLGLSTGAIFSDTANDGGVVIGSDFTFGYIQGSNAAGTAAKDITIQPEGGNLLVGTSSSVGARLYVLTSNSSAIRGDASLATTVAMYGVHTSNSSTGYVAYFLNSGAVNGQYLSNTGSWQAISDARLKTDVKNLDSTSRLLQLRPVDYLWKSQETSEEPSKRSLGFIAQEVKEVFPELVTVSPDGMFGVEYTGLISPLVKAIQEQQALITALTARITALETP